MSLSDSYLKTSSLIFIILIVRSCGLSCNCFYRVNEMKMKDVEHQQYHYTTSFASSNDDGHVPLAIDFELFFTRTQQ